MLTVTQLLCFCTLSNFLLFKTLVSETGFCLHHQAEPTQLGQIGGANPYLRTQAQGRI
jgi:hypothetical protein